MYKENWNEVDRTDIEAYIGLLILCGVYKSRNENVASLWDADTGRANICKAHAKFICESCEYVHKMTSCTAHTNASVSHLYEFKQ